MPRIIRRSPVRLNGTPILKDIVNQWQVVKTYENEGDGPWISDISHFTRWDIQCVSVFKKIDLPFPVPDTPGETVMNNEQALCRMNPGQALVWHLNAGHKILPDIPAVTDITDAAACFALYGPQIFSLMEKLTSLDLQRPAESGSFFVQGPVCYVPCQLLVIGGQENQPGLLMACPRGYAADMTAVIENAGKEFLLHPAGEERISGWLQSVAC